MYCCICLKPIHAHWYRIGCSQIPASIFFVKWSWHGDGWFAKWHWAESQIKGQWLWGLVNREKFPLLTACALKVSAYFGSTYLCEMAFSQMKIIKSKYRSRLTDRHLTDCLKLAVSSYEPDFRGLTDSIQSQPSHWLEWVTLLQQFCLLVALRKVMLHKMGHNCT